MRFARRRRSAMRSPPVLQECRSVGSRHDHAMEKAGSRLWDISMNPSTSPVPSAERDAVLANPGFGGNFTDNMVRAKWTADKGWHDAELVAYGPLLLDPATNFIHYGQAIFEGLKAYRHAEGSIKTFRPFKNAQRFAASARRLAMAELPEELFVASIEALVRQDHEWVPRDAEKTFTSTLHVLNGDWSGSQASRQLLLPVDRVPGRCLLAQGPQAGERVVVR